MDAHSFVTGLAAAIFPIVIVASIVEALTLMFVKKREYDWRAALASFSLYIAFLFSELVPLAIGLPGAMWFYEHRVIEPEKLGIWAYVILFLSVEFLYYWGHRFAHRMRWFWVSHGVHHTSNDLNIATSYRIGITHRIMANYIIYSPVLLLGFPPETMFIAVGIVVGYQFWLHVDWIPKLGFLEGIINTPSAHRVHHGGNLEYVDANYGGLLMIFDRMFGTYVEERDDVPVRYGLVNQIHTRNPIKIVMHFVTPLVRDLMSARSVREFLGYMFMPPGWRPDGNGTTTEDLRRRASASNAASTASDVSGAPAILEHRVPAGGASG